MSTPTEKKLDEDQVLFKDAQKALDARLYVEAIDLFKEFIKKYPDSKGYSWAFQRLGESFEGLIEIEYRKRVESGQAEKAARQAFLEKYGFFECWEELPDGLYYDLSHYRLLLEKFPDSPIADEAAYRIIKQDKDYRGDPAGYLKEIKELESILEKYTSTTLRPEILYKMAYRCHILYEIYSFTPDLKIKDKKKAERYRGKAVYLYKLTLKAPDHSKFSAKAWRSLELLERGTRIYRFE
jgi:hypothetical protein